MMNLKDSINRRFGAGTVTTEGDAPEPISVTSTGIPALDAALGCGGWPNGRVVEVFGGKTTGKTTVALAAVAAEQRLGRVCALLGRQQRPQVLRQPARAVELAAGRRGSGLGPLASAREGREEQVRSAVPHGGVRDPVGRGRRPGAAVIEVEETD